MTKHFIICKHSIVFNAYPETLSAIGFYIGFEENALELHIMHKRYALRWARICK